MHQALTLIEGLVKESQVSESGLPFQDPPDHPGHGNAGDRQAEADSAKLGKALILCQLETLVSQPRAHGLVCRAKMIAQGEKPQLRGALAGSEQPVVIPGPPLVLGCARAPLMLAQRMAQNDKKYGQRAQQQRRRKPVPERDQDRAHGQQGQAILQHAAKTLHKSDGAVARVGASAVQAIVEVGRLVKGKIRGNGFLVDQRTDAILDQLRLRGADPARGDAQRLREQQDRGEQRRNHKDGADAFPNAAGSHGRHEVIHEGARQIDRRHGQQALHEQQPDPDQSLVPRRFPDQLQGTGKIAQLRHRSPHFGLQQSQVFSQRNVRRRGVWLPISPRSDEAKMANEKW